MVRLGLPDSFVEHGTVGQLMQITGIDKASIKGAIISICHDGRA